MPVFTGTATAQVAGRAAGAEIADSFDQAHTLDRSCQPRESGNVDPIKHAQQKADNRNPAHDGCQDDVLWPVDCRGNSSLRSSRVGCCSGYCDGLYRSGPVGRLACEIHTTDTWFGETRTSDCMMERSCRHVPKNPGTAAVRTALRAA
jgi:hypothetical protein